MSVTRQQVVDRYPEFSDIESGTYFDTVIASACRQVSQRVWAALYTDGVLALTAHFLELGRSYRQGKSGSVTNEKVGDLMRSFNSGGSKAGYLSSTSYGQEFERMKRALPTRPLIC